MKNLIILFVFFGINTFGQSEPKVLQKLEDLRKAMLNADLIALKNLTHSKLSYGHSSGKIENQTEFIEAFATGASAFTNLDFSEIQIITEGNTAIVRHVLLGDTNNKGSGPGTIKIKVLLVYKKLKNEWKLLARQAVRI
jgi:ketosteroid isomerase-like protein